LGTPLPGVGEALKHETAWDLSLRDHLGLWGFEGCRCCVFECTACSEEEPPALFSIGFTGFRVMFSVSQGLLRRSWCHFVNLHKWVGPLAVWREIMTWSEPVWRERDAVVIRRPSL
jgi:hypothetical protein